MDFDSIINNVKLSSSLPSSPAESELGVAVTKLNLAGLKGSALINAENSNKAFRKQLLENEVISYLCRKAFSIISPLDLFSEDISDASILSRDIAAPDLASNISSVLGLPDDAFNKVLFSQGGEASLFIKPNFYKVDTVLEIKEVILIKEIEEIEVKKLESINLNGLVEKIMLRHPEVRAKNIENTNLIIIEIKSSLPNQAIEFLQDINKEILEENKEEKIIIIKEPTISHETVKPRILFNMIIASVLGLFLGICLAFLMEWWEKNKNFI